MKKYGKYKSTGIDWIGEIPNHWNVKPIKYLLKKGRDGIRIGPFGSALKSTYLKASGLKVYGQENIINDNFNLGGRYINNQKFNELKEYEIFPGDVLVTMMGTTGKCKVVPDMIDKGIMDSHLIRLRIDETQFLPQLFADLINSSYYLFNQIKRMSKGSIMEGLNSSIVKNLIVLIPPIEEQVEISNFLDEKTSQIDKLISNKKKLIELLKEERISVIDKAVNGVGRNWERKKLKYVVSKVGSGVTPKGGANVYLLEGIPLLRSQNIFSDRLSLDDVAYISDEIDNQMANSRIQEGDVLLNITGASIGRSFYVPPNFGIGNVNQHVCIIRPIQSKIRTKYLHAFLVSNLGQTQIDMCQNGANREGLNFQQLKSFEIPLPNLKMQDDILDGIQNETMYIDKTIVKIGHEIDLLKEYRTALISEAVTGKIKVV
jgi:type I restriction enzyme S subunit